MASRFLFARFIFVSTLRQSTTTNLMSNLFRTKDIAALQNESDGDNGLKRTLTATNLVALGIGAIIGAGLFVRTAAAAANNAGPAVTIGFVIAGIGCALA